MRDTILPAKRKKRRSREEKERLMKRLRKQAQLAMKKGNVRSAVEFLAQAVDIDKKNGENYRQLAIIYRDHGDIMEYHLEKLFEKAKRYSPDHVPTLIDYAKYLRMKGEPQEAEEILVTYQGHPEAPWWINVELATVYRDLDRLEEAQVCLSQVSARKRTDPLTLFCGLTTYLLAGKLSEFVSCTEELLLLSAPKFISEWRERIDTIRSWDESEAAWLNLADLFDLANELRWGAEILHLATTHYPKSAEIWFQLCQLHKYTGNDTLYHSTLTEASLLESHHRGVLWEFAEWFYEMGDLWDAEKATLRYLSAYPDDGEAQERLRDIQRGWDEVAAMEYTYDSDYY